VSFDLRPGKFLSVVGPNGAGKTTLLRCLDGIVRNYDGRIVIAGRDLSTLPQRDVARLVAYVPQLRNSLLPFRAREFVLMSRYAHHGPLYSPGREDHEAVARALKRTGTESFADRKLNTLSGGECQKIFIAAALAQETPILLLDEPVTFLDPKYQNEVNALLRQLTTEAGTTIVCVSHELNSALRNADRVLALRNGTVAFNGPAREAMNATVLADIFDTEFILAEHPHDATPVIVPAIAPADSHQTQRKPAAEEIVR
jgi:iron complex transport system ATP-binding protein